MALAILVQRGAGDKQGPDIIDPLVTTIPVALSRGQAELDEQSSNLQAVQLDAKYRSGVRLGQLIEVIDSFQGESWRGKVVGIRHIASGQTLLSQLVVRKPT